MTIVACDKFVMNRGTLTEPMKLGGDGRFRILAVTQGSVSVDGDPSGEPMNISDTVLLPACLPPTLLSPGTEGAEVLEIFVPE